MIFQLKFEIQSDFKYLPFLTRIFKALKIRKAKALTQILVEAYNNAVIHGHKKRKEKWIGIDLFLTSKKARIRLFDQGRGIKKMDHGPKSMWKTTGRGLELIRNLSNRVTSKKRGDKHILEVLCLNNP